MLDSFDSKGKAGLVLSVIGILLLLAGTVGYTFSGVIEDVPTPNTPNQAFFADEPLPKNILSPLVAAEVTITWDRNDVWMGIVHEDEKERCKDVPSNYFSSGLGCDGASLDFVAGNPSATATEGFTWEMESGTYFAALGAKESGLPSGTAVVVSYDVHLGHSLLSVVLSFGGIVAGGVLIYYGRDPSL